MTDTERVQAAWERIERWLAAHLPGALENLRGPASEPALLELERAIGRELPEALRASLARHDGESQNWPPNAMSDAQWLLPATETASNWVQQRDLALQLGGSDDTPAQWKAQIQDGIISVQGPVKPVLGSAHWIPLSNMNGDVYRYLDFDPAAGGKAGQVIEVDPEGCSHRVLAPSLADFLEQYAAELEAGRYEIEHDAIVAVDGRVVEERGLPDYLRDVQLEPYSETEAAAVASEFPDPRALAPGEETTLVGEMGLLVGGTRMIFSLETPSGRRHWITAHPEATRGYGAIAIEQGARVRVRRAPSGWLSSFAQRVGLRPVALVAVEYEMLRTED